MGCFFACFSASKNKKHQHLVDGASSNRQKHEAKEAVPFNSIIVKKENLGELLNYNGKKKVTFDLNVKTHEEFPVESSDKLLKKNEDKEIEETEETAKGNRSSVPDLTANSNVVCKSQNNRYQNIAESEDEVEDLDLELSDLNDDDNEFGKAENEPELVMEESSESLFSLSIESRKQVCEVESGEKEVTSPMPVDKSPTEELKPIGLIRNVQSVLNPVKNLAQWREAKAKAKASISLKDHEEKENINVEQGFDDIPISPEPSFRLAKLCSNDKKVVLVGQETAVDTSLSSWLEPENTPNSKASTNSVGNSASKKTSSPMRSHEDRPTLGALTIDELKQHSASTSPRKCRSRSPDETPIVGTVGSYWSHTGQAIDSDSSSASRGTPRTRSRNIREERRVKWNPIPFEARLDEGIAGGV